MSGESVEKRLKRLAGVTAALVALLVSAGTRADTPIDPWDAARDPAAADRYALHLRVRQWMVAARPGPREALLVRAEVLLEQAGAADSPDARLRFDLGDLEYKREKYERAIEVLTAALDMTLDDPTSTFALTDLAAAYAKLDRSAEEKRVYQRLLPRLTDDRERSTVLLNLAEAEMHLGDLDEAVAGYRAAIEVADQLPNVFQIQDPTGTLAVWGLAVALDRSGDVLGGGKEAKLALELDRDMVMIRTNRDNVFFAPERERDWYVALGRIEQAKQAGDPRSAALFWHQAEGCWRDYLDDVKLHAEADRWVDLARARLERAHAQRVAAERRVKGAIAYAPNSCIPDARSLK
jgi:tetratricopeptide (TPR) repeat protein